MTILSQATATQLDSARVLVVDDDRNIACAIERILEQKGLIVDCVHDAEAALSAVASRHYDAMVLDLRMSNEDGLDLLRQIRALPESPPAILHSAYLDVQTTVAAMRCGVDDVIEKSISPNLLVDRVWELTRKRKVVALRPTDGTGPSDPVERILGETAAVRQLRQQIRRVSEFGDISVLIEGETGTGKELIAEAIHGLSAPDQPMVALNCAAIPEQLFESELFGHEAGSFTNAKTARIGLLEQAQEGTVFLDEVGEMPSSVQPKLLRALETREFRRVGSNRSRPLRARVVSATNRKLRRAPLEVFRQDLYFRLGGYTIASPPLRERLDDLPTLTREFASRFARRYGFPQLPITESALNALRTYRWPGNVRELRLVIENAAMLAAPAPIDHEIVQQIIAARRSDSIPPPSDRTARTMSGVHPIVPGPARTLSLPEVERDLIVQSFAESSGNLTLAAKRLGIPRSTLRDRLRKLGVR